MRKIALFSMCVLLFTSCTQQDLGKNVYVSGFCSLQTEKGKVRVSQPAYIHVDYNTATLTEFNSVITAKQNDYQYTDDGTFAFLLYNTGLMQISAKSEFGDTIQYFSDTLCLTADRDYTDLEIVLNHYQHVFHPKLYNITQKKESLGFTSSPYGINVCPGDSLRFTINHDAFSEIRLYTEETQSNKNGIETYQHTFATFKTPGTSSFVFVMPAHNPYPDKDIDEYSIFRHYVFVIDFTTLHYGTFIGGAYYTDTAL